MQRSTLASRCEQHLNLDLGLYVTLRTTYLTTYSVGVPCSVSVCALVSGCWCARGCAVCVILALVFESVSGD